MAASTDAELDTHRPFTRADAIAAGIEPRLLRGSRYRRIFRGVYVASEVAESPLLRAQAALALLGGKEAFASHATAGRIHQVPLPALPEEHVTVLSTKDRRTYAGVRVHVADKAQVRDVKGVPVSTYERMFVELATMLTLVDLVVVGDNLVRRGLCRRDELLDYCRTSDQRSARAAARAAEHVRERVDSPMETRLRMLIVLAGLPEPEVNLKLRDVEGGVVRKYDLSYPAVKVIVEYDGRHHVERIEQWEADLERREAIDDDGWRILVVTSSGIYKEPQRTVLRVWRLLRARKLPGVPSTISGQWRAHFPGHS